MAGPELRPALLLSPDAGLVARLSGLARDYQLSWVSAWRPGDPPPAVVVVDLEPPAAAAEVSSLRERWPEALLVGFLAAPRPQVWVAAQRAGCDVVTNKGALRGALRAALAAGRDRRRRYPLLAAADVAGRLGCVYHAADTPVGPVALYALPGGGLRALADRCPHAGARLSAGELSEGVLECPAHGSRFQLADGARIRGPADDDLRVFGLVIDAGQVFLIVDPMLDPGPG